MSCRLIENGATAHIFLDEEKATFAWNHGSNGQVRRFSHDEVAKRGGGGSVDILGMGRKL